MSRQRRNYFGYQYMDGEEWDRIVVSSINRGVDLSGGSFNNQGEKINFKKPDYPYMIEREDGDWYLPSSKEFSSLYMMKSDISPFWSFILYYPKGN